MQVPRRVEQEQVTHLWYAAHVTAQQIGDGLTSVRRSRHIRVEQRSLPQDEIRGLQRARRLLRQRPGNIIVLALGHHEGRLAIAQRIKQRRQPHRRANQRHDQHQPHAQRRPARTLTARGRR